MDDTTRTELEAAAFRRLRQHLMDDRPDVQNIDLMNLAGFCRNCLSRWYEEAASERGIAMSKAEAREIAVEFTSLSKTYSMPGWRIGFAVGNERLIGF